ncbi:MAG: hypothetical protein J6Z12_02130, partial [Paludibacteraceae bacterium]|nr:hypothetical protein [Paludibacteraceae bacterium]
YKRQLSETFEQTATFEERQKRAVAEKGIVTPGLNEMTLEVVDVPRHDFTGTGKQALGKARSWAKENLVGEHLAYGRFVYSINEDAIGKYLSESSAKHSESLGVHLAALKSLPQIIEKSIDVEQHADYKKNDGIRAVKNGVGRNDILVHRLYGAARIDNGIYRTKTTVYEYMNDKNIPHDYQITKVELLISGSSASNALSNPTHVSAAKILQGIEKSYDKGKKVLGESLVRRL